MKEITEKDKESIQLWDERDLQWKLAYEARVRRLETIGFVKAVLFDSDAETYTSDSFECAPFRQFLLLLDLVVTGAPTDIQIWVEFSHDNVNFYKLMDGPFGSLMYEDTAGDKKECVSGNIVAHWMRIYVVSSGCDVDNTFTLSVTAEVSG